MKVNIISCIGYVKHKILFYIICFVTINWFNLVCRSAPVERKVNVTQAVDLNRIGMSSEWSGNSVQATTAAHNETKSWVRSKVRIKPLQRATLCHLDLNRLNQQVVSTWWSTVCMRDIEIEKNWVATGGPHDAEQLAAEQQNNELMLIMWLIDVHTHIHTE